MDCDCSCEAHLCDVVLMLDGSYSLVGSMSESAVDCDAFGLLGFRCIGVDRARRQTAMEGSAADCDGRLGGMHKRSDEVRKQPE